MSDNDRTEASFTMALPSNDPSVVGGTNTNFTIQLQQSLDLNGVWQLTLLEMIYQPSVTNQTLYVYTDIIKPQIVGSESVQLVKTIPGVATTASQLIYRQPDPQEWRTINLNSLQQIEISVRDGTGAFASLTGNTVITFQLRRIK